MSTTVSDPLVGRLLDGRYQVEARLARGGMATVYTAHDTRLDRKVALKVMHQSYAEDEAFVARFIREARSAARLSHPNVVAVYDQGEDDGTVFLAMEYVPGRTLRDVLRERGRLGPKDALEVLERVLSALAGAHQAGLVHRDVKPENVLISDEGRVKVADFGLARAIATTSKTTGVILGTVAYLSPEQVKLGDADARSDVYSAGVLLYEMLTGDTPFHADTPIAVAYKHVHEDVPDPAERLPSLPRAVSELVGRATDREPDRRPANAAELLGDVAAVRRTLPDDADSEETVIVPVGESDGGTLQLLGPGAPPGDNRPTDGRLPRPRRGRNARAVVALVVVLLITAGAGAMGWWYGEGRWTHAPSLDGMAAAAAMRKADQLGFEASRETAYDEKMPRGRVIETRPPGGSRVLRGSQITVVVSRGRERHPVPDLTGMSQAAAESRLEASRLALGKVSHRYSRSVDRGDVISSHPKAGTKMRRGGKVDLVVSKGVPPISVPALTGLSEAAARQAVERLGLTFASSRAYDTTVPKGEVISQDPAHGTRTTKGSTVSVLVSKGPRLVAVPNVTGQPLGKARKTLEAAGFTVEVHRLLGREGKVVAERPMDRAAYGSTIRLWVL